MTLSLHVLGRSRTLAVLAFGLRAAPRRFGGGRCRGHPLTACAPSGFFSHGRDEEQGFAGPNKERLLPWSATWSYLPNSGDRRLSGVSTTGLSSGQYSTFQYTTDAENQITGTIQTSDSAISYPPASGQQTASFNNLNQVLSLQNPPPSSQSYTYNLDGDLTSDGTRGYSWDVENRLVSMTYPGQAGKTTAFTYDGLGRRITITDTPAGGGSAVTTSYVWCGAAPCQARNSANAVTRAYYSEGEYVPGSPATSYYYGIDNLGSVRRVFYSGGTPAYDYDPYGDPLQTTAPVTDYGYAGMFLHQPSGLYLTFYRAYDPYSGRWLSRDPAGEIGGINLYGYVGEDPVNDVDPLGLWPFGAPGESSAIQQLTNALENKGVPAQCASKIAQDVANALGWGDIPMARNMQNTLQNGEPLTPSESQGAQNFINGLPSGDQQPLNNIMNGKSGGGCGCH